MRNDLKQINQSACFESSIAEQLNHFIFEKPIQASFYVKMHNS